MHRALLATVGTLMLVVGTSAVAAPPTLLTYQGALTDTAGNPANATYSMTFEMYNGATGGGPLWSETVAPVNVVDGVFTVVLGGTTPLPAGLAGCRFLQVSVDRTPMLPRHRLTSVPYALESANAATLAGQSWNYYRNATNLNAGTVALARLPAIDSARIKDGDVKTVDLADGAVTASKLATNSVTGVKVADGSLTAADLAAGAVTGLKIKTGEIVEGNVGGSVFGARNTGTEPGSSALAGLSTGSGGSLYGVLGTAASGFGNGVRGEAKATIGFSKGVYGVAYSASGTGVYGLAVADSGDTWGVAGKVNSPDGHALHAYCADAKAYGLYVEKGKAYFQGYATFAGGHGDLAENYRGRGVEAGDVVVIGEDGVLAKCAKASDATVAGIVSTSPTMKLNGRLEDGDGVAPLALVGRVACKVDASERPIKPGDLLVTSDRPGHAMKCPSKRPAAGAVLGKALEGLDKGTGVIQVLVTLR